MIFSPKIELTRGNANDWEKIVKFELTQSENKHYHCTGTLESAKEFFKNSVIYLIWFRSVNVGYISYEINQNEAYLNSIAIIPKYQNKGIGTKAVSKISHMIKKDGIRDAWLVTHPENKCAIRIYEKNGFKIQRKVLDYWGDGEPRLKLTKSFA